MGQYFLQHLFGFFFGGGAEADVFVPGESLKR